MINLFSGCSVHLQLLGNDIKRATLEPLHVLQELSYGQNRLASDTVACLDGVYEFVVGKQEKKEYPHLYKKKPQNREETQGWKRMSR